MEMWLGGISLHSDLCDRTEFCDVVNFHYTFLTLYRLTH